MAYMSDQREMAVAFAAAFGLFVLAEKARHIGEHTRRRLREQQDEGR